jgi:hypothetical protein
MEKVAPKMKLKTTRMGGVLFSQMARLREKTLGWVGLFGLFSSVVIYQFYLEGGKNPVAPPPCDQASIPPDKQTIQKRVVESLLPSIKILSLKLPTGASFTEDNNKFAYMTETEIPAFENYTKFLEANPDCCEFAPSQGENPDAPNQVERADGWTGSILVRWRDRYVDAQQLTKSFQNLSSSEYFFTSNCGDFSLKQSSWFSRRIKPKAN